MGTEGFASHDAPAGPGLDGTKWEISFYEDILRRNPDYVEVLMLLGNLYTGRKMYAKGLEVDRRLATLKKTDPIVHYNLACSYALLRQPDDAFRALFQAIRLGYRDVEHMEGDSDLDSVRSDPRYRQAIQKMRRRTS
jgi:tetratricopeptide (TPR) repeat protein